MGPPDVHSCCVTENEAKEKTRISAEENSKKRKKTWNGWVVDLIVSLWQLLDLHSRLNQRQRKFTIQPRASLLSIRTKIEFVEKIGGRNLQ